MCNNIEESYRRVLSELNDGYTAFHKVGAVAIDPGLDTTMELARRLGDPQNAYRTIHVGGTNGKGSVAHTLASVLQSARLSCGTLHFAASARLPRTHTHRWQNDSALGGSGLYGAVQKVEYGFHPSFFEVCTLMAFWCFAKAGVDVAVVEVGLGGRLDSTNIITPMLSVVTNISLDHTGLLGNTEPLIAAEKPGYSSPECQRSSERLKVGSELFSSVRQPRLEHRWFLQLTAMRSKRCRSVMKACNVMILSVSAI